VFDLLFVIAREWKIGAEEAGEGGAGHTRQRREVDAGYSPPGWLVGCLGRSGWSRSGVRGCVIGRTGVHSRLDRLSVVNRLLVYHIR
jgi:hypothetical protein